MDMDVWRIIKPVAKAQMKVEGRMPDRQFQKHVEREYHELTFIASICKRWSEDGSRDRATTKRSSTSENARIVKMGGVKLANGKI